MNRPLICIDENGNKTFYDSISQASEKLGLERTSISGVVNGHAKTLRGLKFYDMFEYLRTNYFGV